MENTSLSAISLYFNFWRESNEKCLDEKELSRTYNNLTERYKQFDSISEGYFSLTLKELFSCEGSECLLNDEQTKNIIQRLKASMVNGKLSEDIFVAIFQYWTRKSISTVNALLIVDVQNDFITGSLRLDQCPAKEDAEEVVPVINNLIKNGPFDVLTYTADWHPEDHCSFFSNIKKHSAKVHPSVNMADLKLFDVVPFIKPAELQQVMWPDHCLQNSWGAQLHKELRKPRENEDIVVYKGQNAHLDSYSTFFDNGKCNKTDLLLQLLKRNVTHVYLVGLAFDVCVAYSAVDSAQIGFNTAVIEDACKGVDFKSMEATRNKFSEMGIKLLKCSDFTLP